MEADKRKRRARHKERLGKRRCMNGGEYDEWWIRVTGEDLIKESGEPDKDIGG